VKSEKLIKDTLHFALSNILQQAMTMIASIFIARSLALSYRYLERLRVLLSYSENFSLGVRHGMNLELPLSLSRGEKENSEAINRPRSFPPWCL